MDAHTATWWIAKRCAILATLAFVATTGCRPAEAPVRSARAPAVKRLTIITPHHSKIRQAFAKGFSAWHAAERGAPVEIQWITRGTPQCVEYIDRLFSGSAEDRRQVTPDLMFGGGIADHVILVNKGYCEQELKIGDLGERIPATIGHLPTRGPHNEWFATGLSSFGIVYNQRDCALRGAAAPETWADLGDPRFRGWLGVAYPEASGSHRQAMAFTLQHLGWEKGWATLLRVLANSRAMLDSSSVVLDQVERGVFLATYAVNFDGLARVDATDGAVRYLNPPGATAATPDISSALKCAADVQLATDFIRYCLSEAGQMVWGGRAEGSARASATLYHYPIDRTAYEKHGDKLAVTENPFETDFGLKLDPERSREWSALLVPLVRAATGEHHILLQQAWARVVEAGMPEAALHELTTPPMTEQAAIKLAKRYAAADPVEAAALLAEWSQKFGERYQRVLDMTKE